MWRENQNQQRSIQTVPDYGRQRTLRRTGTIHNDCTKPIKTLGGTKMALTKSQLQLLEILRTVARGLGEEGRCLTDLIGELSACRYLNLKWKPSDGYDALAKNSERVQIKSRKSWTTVIVNPSGRLEKFGRKAGYKFDKGVYVGLDQHFEVSGIWKMDVDEIKELEDKLPSGKPLHVGTFRSKARRAYP